LKEKKLYAKFSKCEFWLEEVKFLRHVISNKGVLVDPTKVEAVLQWEPQKTVTEIHIFSVWQDIVEDSLRNFLK